MKRTLYLLLAVGLALAGALMGSGASFGASPPPPSSEPTPTPEPTPLPLPEADEGSAPAPTDKFGNPLPGADTQPPAVYLTDAPEIHRTGSSPSVTIAGTANDRGRGGSAVASIEWELYRHATGARALGPTAAQATFGTPGADARVDWTAALSIGELAVREDYRLVVRAEDAAGNWRQIVHDIYLFGTWDGWLAAPMQENPDFARILIGEELTFDDAASGVLNSGEGFQRLYIDGKLVTDLGGVPETTIKGRVPPRTRVPSAEALVKTDQGRVFEWAAAEFMRVALVALGKVREVAAIDVSNPDFPVEMGRIPISDPDETHINPPFDVVAISPDGRMAAVATGMAGDGLLPNSVSIFNLIEAIGSPNPTEFIFNDTQPSTVGDERLLVPTAVAFLDERRLLITPEYGLEDLPGSNTNDDRNVVIVDVGLINDGADPSSPIDVLGTIELTPAADTTLPGANEAIVSAFIHGNLGFFVHGPYLGRISLVDLGTNTEIKQFFEPEDMPQDLPPGMPNGTGAADIAVTRDGVFAVVSNGAQNPGPNTVDPRTEVPTDPPEEDAPAFDRVITVLRVDLTPGAENISALGSVEIGVDREPDPTVNEDIRSMGVTISSDDRYAFIANPKNESLTAFEIMAAEEFLAQADNGIFTPPSGFTLVRSGFRIVDVKQIPNTNKVLISFGKGESYSNQPGVTGGVKVVDFSGLGADGLLVETGALDLPPSNVPPDTAEDDLPVSPAEAIAIQP